MSFQNTGAGHRSAYETVGSAFVAMACSDSGDTDNLFNKK